MTDFGMAKLLGTDPRLTPTYCPGTNGYMSPEALADPPSYTTKLDIFSCGVLFVQLITRKFPDPGPRTYTVELNDPRFPSGRVHVDVPELERRKAHIDPIDPTHPLLRVALDCMKDKEEPRPTAEQLCSRLIALKGSTAYQDSLQQTPEELAAQTPPARQLREREDRVEDLTQQVEQLQLQSREDIQQKDEIIRQKNMLIQQKDELIRQKDEAIAYLRRQLQATRQENEQVVAALQQSVVQKDQLLQEKERQIQELQQSREECDAGPLKLEWRDGPRTPFGTFGEFVAVSKGMVYCCDFASGTILMYNSWTGQWTVLPECSKKKFSIAVVNGLLTAIGGKHSDTPTKTLLSLSHDRLLGISRQKWTEQFPPMTYYHNDPTVATTDISLIVAGGWGPDRDKAPVEVMDTKTLRWSTVASLPHHRWQATATICGGRMYIGGGWNGTDWTKSVLMCEVSDLLQSATTQPRSPPGRSCASQVWREIAELQHIGSPLITLRGQLLAIGGTVTESGEGETSKVRQYDVITNSWNVISHMINTRHQFFAAVLPNDRVMVVGGWVSRGKGKDNVEIASIV